MKLFISTLLIFSFSFSFGQKNVLENVNKLIEQKKYESAVKVLESADPDNKNPDIVIAKTDLFLNYFITSIMHQMFSVRDLKPNEDLMELRGAESTSSMYMFQADSIFAGLIRKYPTNYKLYKTLGFYYHEVYTKYPDSWLLPDSVVIDRFFKNYKIAYDHGVYDYWSLYGIGYSYLVNGDYKNAITYLEKSVELKKDYPTGFYNLAYAYSLENQTDKAMACAKKAYDLYDYPQFKSDAARMIASIYGELKQDEKALEFYYKADSIQPNFYYNLKPLLYNEILMNKELYKKRTKQFFLLAPDNSQIFLDLIDIYKKTNKLDELIAFLQTEKNDYKNDLEISGNIILAVAIAQYHKGDYKSAKETLGKALEAFEKIFKPNHEIFKVIEVYYNKMK